MPSTGRVGSIDDRAPDPNSQPADDAEHSSRSSFVAVMLGVLVVIVFVSVQLAAGALLHALGVDLQLAGDVSVGEAAALGAIQVGGILAIVALVAAGFTSWHRLGVGGRRRSFVSGWQALLPVGLLVIGPSVGVALASDVDIVADRVTPMLAVAFIALALFISINEELWFRGLLVDALQTARRPWLTIIASAVLFGLPHAGDTTAHLVNAVAVTLAVGIPFTVVRLRFGGLGSLIVWHTIIDTWAFLHTASVRPQGSPDAADIAATLVLPSLVAIGYMVWYRRAVNVTPSPRP